jgi:hypothetical protein
MTKKMKYNISTAVIRRCLWIPLDWSSFSRPTRQAIKIVRIKELQKNVTLSGLQALPYFPDIRPLFHICFYTWSAPVIIKTDGRHRGLYVDDGTAEKVYYGYIMTGLHGEAAASSSVVVPDGLYQALHMNNKRSAQF